MKKSQPEIKKILAKALNRVDEFDFTPMLKISREQCTSYFNVQSKEELERDISGFYGQKSEACDDPHTDAIDTELRFLEALSMAHMRIKQQNKDMYRNFSIKRDKKYVTSVIASNLNISAYGKPRSAVDGLMVAIAAKVDPSPLWGQYGYFSYSYQCSLPLSSYLRGFQDDFTAQQLYTLYRFCNHNFPQSMYNRNNVRHSALTCQALLKNMVDRVFGFERFNSNARIALVLPVVDSSEKI